MDIVKILKKNTSIIIPAATALAAILLFIPTILIQGKISKKIENSLRLGSELKSAIKSAVPATQLEFLKTFEDKHQEDANEIQKLAIQTSQRELLSYKIFPEPNETSVQIFNEFKRTYNTAIENLIKDMNALDAPTDAEVRKEIGAIKNETPAEQKTTGKGESSEKITELICKKRSQQIPVYAKPQVFSGYAFWTNWDYVGVESAVKDCWYCQLAYWIHQDIVDTVRKINAGSNRVADSPVKRLLGIRFKSANAGDTGSNGKEMPVYVTGKEGRLCQPWTGRISNDQIDVIHFSLAAVIRADDVLRFMNELCSEKTHTFSGYKNDQPAQQFKHNQITILQSSIEPVNKEDPDNKRYLYGQEAVVYLNLICEYLFNKEGYDIIEPNSVKPALNQAESPTGSQRISTPRTKKPKSTSSVED
ncbi:MAG: hypothetical protein ABSE89_04190 [Sedimentisphaerales bacterium]